MDNSTSKAFSPESVKVENLKLLSTDIKLLSHSLQGRSAGLQPLSEQNTVIYYDPKGSCPVCEANRELAPVNQEITKVDLTISKKGSVCNEPTSKL